MDYLAVLKSNKLGAKLMLSFESAFLSRISMVSFCHSCISEVSKAVMNYSRKVNKKEEFFNATGK